MTYDCIIIGTGPAGGTAAYHLAKQGHSVLILGKDSLPADRPCGGGVSPAIAQWFDFDFSPVISLKVKKVRYTYKMADPVEVELATKEPMWMIRRDTFDRFLVQQAQTQGAELRDGVEVKGISFVNGNWQVSTNGEPATGRYLIAADGANSQVAQWLGFKPHPTRTAAALEIPGNPTSDPAICFEMGLLKNGFIWQFPKADGYSLGAGTLIGGEDKKLPQQLMEYANKAGLDVKSAQPQTRTMSLWTGNQTLHAQNAVLAGDAAGVADPFTAEGIRPAMYSGLQASQAIHQAIGGNGEALADYTKVMTDVWGAEMVWASRLAGAFYRFPGIGYKAGVKQPIATQLMLKILCGEDRYSEAVSHALKRLSGGLFKG
jgi:geranylgeranyl reductase family protein